MSRLLCAHVFNGPGYRPKSGNVESLDVSVFKVLEELSNRFSKRLVGQFYIPSSTEGRF